MKSDSDYRVQKIFLEFSEDSLKNKENVYIHPNLPMNIQFWHKQERLE